MSAAKKIIDELKTLLNESWREQLELKEVMAPGVHGDYSRTIGIARGMDPKNIIELALADGFRHVCQDSNVGFEKELNTSALMLLHPEVFFRSPFCLF